MDGPDRGGASLAPIRLGLAALAAWRWSCRSGQEPPTGAGPTEGTGPIRPGARGS